MMEVLNNLLTSFSSLSEMMALFFIVAGVILGVIAGALPGLSPSTAVALLVPFSYGLESRYAFLLLTSIYIAANYGGSITAILINTPGTPAAAVTAFDGYPLTEKGEGGKALGTAIFSSAFGGSIGILILIFFAIPLAKWAIEFSPADYFALAIFGLGTVVSMGKGNMIKSLMAISFGLLIKTVGIDPMKGVARFTFGEMSLFDGFHLIPALIGFFALATLFEKLEEIHSSKKVETGAASQLPKVKDYLQLKWTLLKGSIIGTIIGVFPGAGATIASFISYDFAKRASSEPESFGRGNLHGIAASESANSASVGGALIPLLSLGIPGSATDAVLLGAFMLHDLNPGPLLFKNHPDLVYGIFTGLIVANIFLLILGFIGNRLFIKAIQIPEKVLLPIIFMLAIIGSYSVNNSMTEVGFCVGFGVLGWLFKKGGIPLAPIVLGLVLGKMIEENFHRAMKMNGFHSFIDSKLSLVLLILTILSFLWPLFKHLKSSSRAH